MLTCIHIVMSSTLVRERNGRRMATTPEVLLEEKRMLDFARNGRGTVRPLGNRSHTFKRDWLNKGQKNAVSHARRLRTG